jgi:hypothetical protein
MSGTEETEDARPETRRAFADAALAEDENLFAPPECIDNHRPLFEARPHDPRLSRGNELGNDRIQ